MDYEDKKRDYAERSAKCFEELGRLIHEMSGKLEAAEEDWSEAYMLVVGIVNAHDAGTPEELREAIANGREYLQEILDAQKPELDTPLGL